MITEEEKKKIDTLREDIRQLDRKRTELQAEIDKLVVGGGAEFEGSFVKYHDDEDDYAFMKVERQSMTNEGRLIYIMGPVIHLDDDPLDAREEDEDPEITYASYEEDGCESIVASMLQDIDICSVEKISREDMEYVFECYRKTMREKLLQ